MRVIPAVLCVAGLAALAACAPGTTSAIPSTPDSGSRGVQGTSVAYGDNQVFVAGSDAIRTYPAAVTGNDPTPTGLFRYPAGWTPVDTVEAPDRTLYVLLTNRSTGRSMVAVYAPRGARMPRAIEQQFKLPASAGTPLSIALVGDGIDVSTVGIVYTYAYAAGNNPSPIRTLTAQGAVVTDKNDRLYAYDFGTNAKNSTVRIYAAAASGDAAPIRTIDSGRPFLTRIVVAKNGTIYGSFSDPLAGFSDVQTIPTAGGAPRVVASYPGSFVYSMSVDKDNYLYLGIDGTPDSLALTGQTDPRLDVYDSQAMLVNGQNAPARTANGLAATGQRLVAIAVGN